MNSDATQSPGFIHGEVQSGDMLRQIDSLQKDLDELEKSQSRSETLYGHLTLPNSEKAIREKLLQISPSVQ